MSLAAEPLPRSATIPLAALPVAAVDHHAPPPTARPAPPPRHGHGRSEHGQGTAALTVAALGVVMGDIGTSPLYAANLAFQNAGNQDLPASVMGVLSLIFWTITFIVSLKYLLLVLNADHHGEGGVLALVNKLKLSDIKATAWNKFLFLTALLGAAMIFGDGMLTPAITVMSAVEGLNVLTPAISHHTLAVSIVILTGLFIAQKLGTERLAFALGPIMLLWFVTLGVFGALAIAKHPDVLKAVSPTYGFTLLHTRPGVGMLMVGAVFLTVTGGEALYADLGHFGRTPIRLAWYLIAMPGLLLNYFGQGAKVIELNKVPENAFYALAPHGFGIPLLILSALAALIASQSIITGAFSLGKQAMEIGVLPPMKILYTSSHNQRHVYIPAVNMVLMAGTLIIAAAFGNSTNLEVAYGIAVASAMITTTVLLIAYYRRGQRRPFGRGVVVVVGTVFFLVDALFFYANTLKIVDGGWVPLAVAMGSLLLMLGWREGARQMRANQIDQSEPLDAALSRLSKKPADQTLKTVVMLSRYAILAPVSMTRLTETIGMMPHRIVLLSVRISTKPWVHEADRIHARPPRFDNVTELHLRFGYLEKPEVKPYVDGFLRGQGVAKENIQYVIGLERPLPPERLRSWNDLLIKLFCRLARNAERSVDRFELPPDRTLEVGYPVRLEK